MFLVAVHLKLGSCMAKSSEAFCRAVAGYIAVHTGNTVEYIDSHS
ncbi:MAG TPA: hypothetical protein VF452_13460 [Candidatus Binatia bacterium]